MTAIEKKSLKVGKYVDTAHVDTVIREYKQTRWVDNSKKIGKDDSLEVWYSVEELEGFLQKIKDHGGDGIRVCFGAYPEDYKIKPEYAGRQTVVFVATKSQETSNSTADRNIYINGENGMNILAYNLGRANPPYTRTGGDADGWGDIGITIVDRGDAGLTVI